MKCLILFVCIGLVALPVEVVYGVGEMPVEEVESTQKEASEAKRGLEQQEKNLEEKFQETEEGTDEYESTRSKLIEVKSKIISLNEFITVSQQAPSDVSQQELVNAKIDIAQSKELIAALSQEFVNATSQSGRSTEEEIQRIKKEVEQSNRWERFKLRVSHIMQETQATIAEFFGAKGTAARVRENLNSIYDALKDYTSKAKNAGKLTALYTDLGNYAYAFKAQGLVVDAAVATWQNAPDEEKNSPDFKSAVVGMVGNTLTDILSLKEIVAENQTSLISQEDLSTMGMVKHTLDTLLGDLGYAIKAQSYYEVLGVVADDPTAVSQKTLEAAYKTESDWLNSHIRNASWGGGLSAEYATEDLLTWRNNLQRAWDTLKDPAKRNVYDKQPIVKQAFDIQKMTYQEQQAWNNQASSQQSNILSGAGNGF